MIGRGSSRGAWLVGGLLTVGCLVPRVVSAQQWHELYAGGVAALRNGQAERAVDLLRGAIEKRSRPGVRVPTYGTNFEPQYFPYLRLAEAYLLLGAGEEAADVLKTSARLGVEPVEERTALETRARALIDAARPPPASKVSIFAAQAQRGELRSRMEMMDVVNRKRLRHGHMVNITKEIMLQGMQADFLQVDRLSQRVIEKARQAKTVRATSKGGTSIMAEMSPQLKWVKTSGLISPDKWGNLPGGEIFTSPGEVNGTFVIDGVVGDYLCDHFGLLTDNPLTVVVKGNRLTEAYSDNKTLEDEFWKYTHTDENSDRVGEFAIGTNIKLTQVIGAHPAGREVPRHPHRLWRQQVDGWPL